MDERLTNIGGQSAELLSKLIRFCLENKLVVGLFVVLVVGWGIYVYMKVGYTEMRETNGLSRWNSWTKLLSIR